MQDLTTQDTQDVTAGRKNAEICTGVTALLFGLGGAGIGASGSFGFGAGIGFTAGLSLGTAVGQTFCSSYFAD